jgi:hypothetical protein
LGDCIFAQGVARHLIEKGHKVIWPVVGEFLEGLSFAYPSIDWRDFSHFEKSIFDLKEINQVDDMTVVPLRFSDKIIGMDKALHMRAKYDLFGLDHRTWRNFATYNRNKQKELELARLMGIDLGSKYTIVNQNFSLGHRIINPKLKNVHYINKIQGYSLFDYSTIIENASHIHAVDSAIFYIFELLELSADLIHLYSRCPHNDKFDHTDYLFTKNYRLRFKNPILI